MKYIKYIFILLTLACMGAALAQERAETVLGAQLQYNLDVAIASGNTVIAELEADGKSTAGLNQTLGQLIGLRASFDANGSLQEIQNVRAQARTLVSQFREEAHSMLDEREIAQIRNEVRAQIGSRSDLIVQSGVVLDLRRKYNQEVLDAHISTLRANGTDEAAIDLQFANIRSQILTDCVDSQSMDEFQQAVDENVRELSRLQAELNAQVEAGELTRGQAQAIFRSSANASELESQAARCVQERRPLLDRPVIGVNVRSNSSITTPVSSNSTGIDIGIGIG